MEAVSESSANAETMKQHTAIAAPRIIARADNPELAVAEDVAQRLDFVTLLQVVVLREAARAALIRVRR